MKIKQTFLLSLSLLVFTVAFSQVGIGTPSPDASSILELDSTDKGLLISRVNLTSVDQDLDGVSGQATGLMVYNTGTILSPGFYFWNGSEWRMFDSTSAASPVITNLICNSAILEPGNRETGTAYFGNLKLPYTGGNGSSYSGGATVTVDGIEFTLRAGKLGFGSGDLIFSAEGTPTTSSPSSLNLNIQGTSGNNLVSFLETANHCSIAVGQGDRGFISQYAQLSFEHYTTAGLVKPNGFMDMNTEVFSAVGISRVKRITPWVIRIDFTVPFEDDKYIVSGTLLEIPSVMNDNTYIYANFGPFTWSALTIGAAIANDTDVNPGNTSFGLEPRSTFLIGANNMTKMKYRTHAYVADGYAAGAGVTQVGTGSLSFTR